MILIQMTMTRECHLPRAWRLNVLPLRCEPSPATETDFPSNDEKVTLSWDLRCPLTSIWQWRPRKGDYQRGRRSLEGGLVRLTSATVGFLIIILIIITIMIIIFAMMMIIIIMASPHVGLGRLASATVFSCHNQPKLSESCWWQNDYSDLRNPTHPSFFPHCRAQNTDIPFLDALASLRPMIKTD